MSVSLENVQVSLPQLRGGVRVDPIESGLVEYAGTS